MINILVILGLLLCLSGYVSSVSDGTQVVASPCDGNVNQQWDITMFAKDSTIRLKSDSGKCLDVLHNSVVPGSVVDVWTCHPNGSKNQQWNWKYLNTTLESNLNNFCLVNMGETFSGAVAMWNCDSENPAWAFQSSDNTIRSSGFCLEAFDGYGEVSINGGVHGRVFDGIGGLSGGGATSRLLANYPATYQSQVLDFLFKPNFGASLQILKVEIGGDAQSTEGTEASHMHYRDDENYFRGYEWWLMEEAKKRNPDILIYGLAWGVPGWIGNGTQNFFTQDNINYHIKWINGAKTYHNITVDYIGIWNERAYTDSYIIDLRNNLNSNGLQHVQVVAHDRNFDILPDIVSNKALSEAVAVVGVHYPGTQSPAQAQTLSQKLWASEDDATSSSNGNTFARIINHNYVQGLMTATIHWNLITSYYNGLQFSNAGLMEANWPWTGHYEVTGPIWAAAHTTQFTKPGWIYLQHGNGTGNLPFGGSYVTLVPTTSDPSDFTIVMETVVPQQSNAMFSTFPYYSVIGQDVQITLEGGLQNINKPLQVWCSDFVQETFFISMPVIKPLDGKFNFSIGVNQLCSITTITTGAKGSYPAPPAPASFPLPYKDSFADGVVEQQATYFTDETGSFAFYQNTQLNTTTLRQVVTEHPITWCGESQLPVSIIGDISYTNYNVSVDFLIEGEGMAGVAGHISNIHQNPNYGGYYLMISNNGDWNLLLNQVTSVANGSISKFNSSKFNNAMLAFVAPNLYAFVNDVQVAKVVQDGSTTAGWAGITSGWNYAQFSNFVFLN